MRHSLRLLRELKKSFWGKWFLLALLIGVVAGFAAIIFQLLTETIQYYSLSQIAGFDVEDAVGERSVFQSQERELRVWLILPVMAIGGLITGILVYSFAPEAEGHGTDGAIDAFHNNRGIIPLRTPIVKTIASAITLGTGGSAGREGPIAQIGAGFGSYLGQRLRLSAHDRRVMLAIGMGAGIGAIFRAPLAGAIFAGEILYREADIEAEVIVPGAIASVVAYSVFQVYLPPSLRFTPLFGKEIQHEVGQILELLPYTALAVALVFASVMYVKLFHATHHVFKRIPIIPHLKPMIGASCAALIVIGVYYLLAGDQNTLAALGGGYGLLQKTISNAGSLSLTLLLAVAATKILATSLTIGSGGSGGVFGPSMVIGGCVGGGVGKYFHDVMPNVVTQPSTFAIVGMAGFFAGCANAPFSTILMVVEMTGDYKLLLPTLWVSSICFILCRRWSLYSNQVDTRLDSPAHKGDFSVDLLEGIQVGDIFQEIRPEITFAEDATLDEIVHSLAGTIQRYFPVFNSANELVGIFSAEDVRSHLYDDVLWKMAIAKDVMRETVITLKPDDDLNHAINQFTALNVDELPVVDIENPNAILGTLRRKETIAAYNKRRLEMKIQKEQEYS